MDCCICFYTAFAAVFFVFRFAYRGEVFSLALAFIGYLLWLTVGCFFFDIGGLRGRIAYSGLIFSKTLEGVSFRTGAQHTLLRKWDRRGGEIVAQVPRHLPLPYPPRPPTPPPLNWAGLGALQYS